MDIEKLKFPIGKFNSPLKITSDLLDNYISDLSNFHKKISFEVENLTDKQLDTRYRENGWTIRQLVHHCNHHLAHIKTLKSKMNWN